MSKFYLVELDGELINLKEYCRRKNLSYKAVSEYNRNHPDIFPQEIVKYYEIKKYDAGLRRSLYIVWHNLISRCNNPNHISYKNYGGRGIKVCDRWNTFIYFCNDMYESYKSHINAYGKKNTTIDRIDVNNDYNLNNCKWSTITEQVNNRRNTIFTSTGEPLSDYCKSHNLKYKTVMNRICNGWSVEDAIKVPIGKPVEKIVLPNGQLLVDYCKNNNKDIKLIHGRLSAGWSVEDALNKPIKQPKYNLPSGESLRAYCKRNNIEYATIYARLKTGKSLEEALKNPTFIKNKS